MAVFVALNDWGLLWTCALVHAASAKEAQGCKDLKTLVRSNLIGAVAMAACAQLLYLLMQSLTELSKKAEVASKL